MAFDGEQLKEIQATVRALLGLEEDQKLGDVLEGKINATLNAYDKRTKKDREATEEKLNGTLSTITDTLKTLGEGGDGGEGEDGDDGVDVSKLSAPVRALFERQQKEIGKVTDQVAAEKKAREKAQGETAEAEQKRAAQDLRVELRKTLFDKDAVGVDYDPTMTDVIVEHLVGRVRKCEAGDGYEMQTGADSVTQDPVYKPLGEGLKTFGGTTVGKRFQVPVKGEGPAAVRGDTKHKAGEMVTADDILGGKMKPSEIAAAADEGKIELPQ